MRVIAGIARGHTLTAPKGLDTRPTTDRMKENLFNMLTPDLPGTRFLDLFCGSGAIGIEALSRGANSTVFVDVSKTAIETVTTNITKTKFSQQSEILYMPVTKALQRLSGANRQFDIIFMDPPYADESLICEVLTQLETGFLLPNHGFVVVEMSTKVKPPISGLYEIFKNKAYGTAQFVFYKLGASSKPHGG